MGIQNVCEKGAEQAAAAAKPPVTTEWNGWKVKDGKVVPGSWTFASTLQKAQQEYDTAHQPKPESKPKPKPEPKKEDEGYGWTTPFTWVSNVFSIIFGFIGDMFKSIFGCCFDYSEKTDAAKPEKKDGAAATDKKAGTPEAGKKEGTPEAGKKEEPTQAENK